MGTNAKKSWGEGIWEDKAKTQGEIGVIQGVRGTQKSIADTSKEVMTMMDSEFLPLVKGKKAADMGVGPLARFSIGLCKRGYKVTGVDISNTTLNYAKKNIYKSGCKNIRLVKDDLTNLKRVGRGYDLVICFGTFGHIPSFLALNTLNSFGKVLKRGGFCAIDFWVKGEKKFSGALREFLYWAGHTSKRGFAKSFEVNCSYYTEEEIGQMIEMSGFKIVKRSGEYFLLKKI